MRCTVVLELLSVAQLKYLASFGQQKASAFFGSGGRVVVFDRMSRC